MVMTRAIGIIALGPLLGVAGPAPAAEQSIVLFSDVPIQFDREMSVAGGGGAVVMRDGGRVAEATVQLPPAAADQRDARRVVAVIDVRPVLIDEPGGSVPADRWPRVGSLSVVRPGAGAGGSTEVELMRFVTGFGGNSELVQDITSLAPLLHDGVTFRASISTWVRPAWTMSARLVFSDDGVGCRRPVFAAPLFNDPLVTAERSTVRARVTIPPGLDRPRLRILTSGHATDVSVGEEFSPRTHVLRIDGREVALWRPWVEEGGSLRKANPASGRQVVDGRELWSSDLDRAGWLPGTIVRPFLIPVQELAPGEHLIELEVRGIRPRDTGDRRPDGSARDESGPYGYWRVSAVVVADEPWPESEAPP
jgi:hypothetical protein